MLLNAKKFSARIYMDTQPSSSRRQAASRRAQAGNLESKRGTSEAHDFRTADHTSVATDNAHNFFMCIVK